MARRNGKLARHRPPARRPIAQIPSAQYHGLARSLFTRNPAASTGRNTYRYFFSLILICQLRPADAPDNSSAPCADSDGTNAPADAPPPHAWLRGTPDPPLISKLDGRRIQTLNQGRIPAATRPALFSNPNPDIEHGRDRLLDHIALIRNGAIPRQGMHIQKAYIASLPTPLSGEAKPQPRLPDSQANNTRTPCVDSISARRAMISVRMVGSMGWWDMK